MTVDDLKRMFKYDAWANDRVLAYARTVNPPSAEITRNVAHIFVGQDVWYSRVVRDGRSFDSVWVEMSLEEAERKCLHMRELWSKYLDAINDSDLQSKIEYMRMGKQCSNTIADVLTHMITHGMYHRGQISMMVRKAGGEPSPTDFIAAAREGVLD